MISLVPKEPHPHYLVCFLALSACLTSTVDADCACKLNGKCVQLSAFEPIAIPPDTTIEGTTANGYLLFKTPDGRLRVRAAQSEDDILTASGQTRFALSGSADSVALFADQKIQINKAGVTSQSATEAEFAVTRRTPSDSLILAFPAQGGGGTTVRFGSESSTRAVTIPGSSEFRMFALQSDSLYVTQKIILGPADDLQVTEVHTPGSSSREIQFEDACIESYEHEAQVLAQCSDGSVRTSVGKSLYSPDDGVVPRRSYTADEGLGWFEKLPDKTFRHGFLAATGALQVTAIRLPAEDAIYTKNFTNEGPLVVSGDGRRAWFFCAPRSQ